VGEGDADSTGDDAAGELLGDGVAVGVRSCARRTPLEANRDPINKRNFISGLRRSLGWWGESAVVPLD